MSEPTEDRTASLMTPARLAQLKVKPKPAASPAVWLDQLAADAGSGHARRLVDLRRQLEAQVRAIPMGNVPAAARTLDEAVDALDVSLVQPRGWLARATGKGKEATATFVAQHERLLRAGEDFAAEARALPKAQAAVQSAIERTLVEMDVELRQVEKIMDQGARWLQDMRNQIRARQAAGGDAEVQKQAAEDAARCELLVARLKLLRAAVAPTQQALERCKAMGSTRASLHAALQALVDGEWQALQRASVALADEAVASGSAEGTDAVRAARRGMQSALEHAGDEMAAVQAQDAALAGEVAALQAPLQAAA